MQVTHTHYRNQDVFVTHAMIHFMPYKGHRVNNLTWNSSSKGTQTIKYKRCVECMSKLNDKVKVADRQTNKQTNGQTDRPNAVCP